MVYENLIQAEVPAANLEHPDWATFDCRFDLTEPAHGEALYQKAHILGAMYAHLERDLSIPHRRKEAARRIRRLQGTGHS